MTNLIFVFCSFANSPKNLIFFSIPCGRPGSSVGIATDYGLEGPGVEPRWGGVEIFRISPDRPWGPPSFLYNGYRVFPGGKERPGRDADPSPPSSAVGHERIELYLYSPYEPYGLYRASVPVQGCTLTIGTGILHLNFNTPCMSNVNNRRTKKGSIVK